MSVTHSSREAVSAYEVVDASREFRALRRRFGSLVVRVIALSPGWYVLSVIVAVAAPGFRPIKVFGGVKVGPCSGAGVDPHLRDHGRVRPDGGGHS